MDRVKNSNLINSHVGLKLGREAMARVGGVVPQNWPSIDRREVWAAWRSGQVATALDRTPSNCPLICRGDMDWLRAASPCCGRGLPPRILLWTSALPLRRLLSCGSMCPLDRRGQRVGAMLIARCALESIGGPIRASGQGQDGGRENGHQI